MGDVMDYTVGGQIGLFGGDDDNDIDIEYSGSPEQEAVFNQIFPLIQQMSYGTGSTQPVPWADPWDMTFNYQTGEWEVEHDFLRGPVIGGIPFGWEITEDGEWGEMTWDMSAIEPPPLYEIPGAPEWSGYQVPQLALPSTPGATGYQVPGAYNIPGMPGTYSVPQPYGPAPLPGQYQTTNMAATPGLPTMGSLPGLPEMGEMPGLPGEYGIPTQYGIPSTSQMMPTAGWYSGMSPELMAGAWEPYLEGMDVLRNELSSVGMLGSQRGGMSGAAADVYSQYLQEVTPQVAQSAWEMQADPLRMGWEAELGRGQEIWQAELAREKSMFDAEMAMWQAEVEDRELGFEAAMELWDRSAGRQETMFDAGMASWQAETARQETMWQTEQDRLAAERGYSQDYWGAQTAANEAAYQAQLGANIYGADIGMQDWQAQLAQQQAMWNAQLASGQYGADWTNAFNQAAYEAGVGAATDVWGAQTQEAMTGAMMPYQGQWTEWEAQLAQNLMPWNILPGMITGTYPYPIVTQSPDYFGDMMGGMASMGMMMMPMML